VTNKANISLLRIETICHAKAGHSRRTTVVFNYGVLPALPRPNGEDFALKMEV